MFAFLPPPFIPTLWFQLWTTFADNKRISMRHLWQEFSICNLSCGEIGPTLAPYLILQSSRFLSFSFVHPNLHPPLCWARSLKLTEYVGYFFLINCASYFLLFSVICMLKSYYGKIISYYLTTSCQRSVLVFLKFEACPWNFVRWFKIIILQTSKLLSLEFSKFIKESHILIRRTRFLVSEQILS